AIGSMNLWLRKPNARRPRIPRMPVKIERMTPMLENPTRAVETGTIRPEYCSSDQEDAL
ncbi:MAG: hypothetical protein M1840_004638, partial [Geoglossum simile]